MASGYYELRVDARADRYSEKVTLFKSLIEIDEELRYKELCKLYNNYVARHENDYYMIGLFICRLDENKEFEEVIQ